MQVIADLHMHSKYSRGCSTSLDLEHIEKYARQKGLSLVGTGDFQHPQWFPELKQKLTETEEGSGIFKTKTDFHFLLQTEISLVYSQDGKGRRVHQVVLSPSFDVAQQVVEYLLSKGRIDYDGRPIFKIPSSEFVADLKNISNDIEIIPAHIWTPWFSLFGSNSGYDDIKHCFGDQLKHIHALETGLSSDPLMNWRLSQLDKFNLVSFSDSHSFWPWRMGREATAFELKTLTYKNIMKALATKDRTDNNRIDFTVEVDPAYGKYHEDGHRNCNIVLSPKESLKINNICPVCKKPLTIGVHHRVEELADRPEGFRPDGSADYKTLIPLSEILSATTGKGVATKAVQQEYGKLLELGSEFDVLLNTPAEQLARVVDQKAVDALMLNRKGKIEIIPGYDGVYGKPVLGEQEHVAPRSIKKGPQKSLGEF